MDIASDKGAGAITSFDVPEGICYVGDGVLSNWPAKDLARAYIELTPDSPLVEGDSTQLD
jgi:hypothetical protein